MSSASVIVNQYAKAAFNAAKQSGIQDKFLAELKLFVDNFSSQFSRELSNPAIYKDDMAKIISMICEKLAIGEKATEFLKIVARARRIKYISGIYNQFLKLYKLDKNILEVKLYSTDELAADQLSKIKDLLQKKYPKNIIEINHILDKNILGGILIKIDSLVIDASLKNQLLAIEKACKSVIS